MADIIAAIMPIPDALVAVTRDPFVAASTYEIMDTKTVFSPDLTFLQRIFDTGVGGYVYYTRLTTDPVGDPPLIAETQPNHTGALVISSHAILKAL